MTTAAELLFDATSIKEVQAQVLSLIPIFERVARASKNLFAQSAKETTAVEAGLAKEIGKQADLAGKAKERAARETAKETERIARDAQKAELNFIKAGQRAVADAERERTQAAKRQADERKRIADEEARHVTQTIQRRSRAFGNMMGGAAGRVMGMAGRVAGIATAVGGGFAVADSLRAGIEEERTAGVIFRGAADKGKIKSTKEVEEMAKATALATGGTKQDVLGGLDMFVRKTGNLGAAEQMLTRLAKLSSAAGADFTDMGNTAAEVFNQLGDSGQTMEVMRALAGQGMAGAIDIKDLGQYGGRLAASAAQFGGPLAGNIESFGAIAQLAKKLGGATDTAEATESVARLSSDFAKHELGFKDLGVDVYTDKSKSKFRSAEDVITESVVKSKGDQGILRELFGERSIKAALGAQVAFSNAGGGDAGEAAIRGQFRSFKSNTPTEKEIETKNTEAMAETGRRINNALTTFHDAINTRLLPMMPGLIDGFTRLIPTIQKIIDFFAGGTLGEGIAKALAAAFALELAKATIGAGITAAFTKLSESFLKLFTGTKAAVVSVQGAVVNVSGGGAVPNVVENAAKLGGGSVALASIPLAVTAGGIYSQYSGIKEGDQKAKDLLGISAETTEEKQAKLAALRQQIMKIEGGQGAQASLRRAASIGALPGFAGGMAAGEAMVDPEAAGAAGKLPELRAQVEELEKSLSTMTNGANALNDVTKSAVDLKSAFDGVKASLESLPDIKSKEPGARVNNGEGI